MGLGLGLGLGLEVGVRVGVRVRVRGRVRVRHRGLVSAVDVGHEEDSREHTSHLPEASQQHACE